MARAYAKGSTLKSSGSAATDTASLKLMLIELQVKVDEVAAVLGLARAKTVASKIKALKDRYNLPIGCSSTKVGLLQEDASIMDPDRVRAEKTLENVKHARPDDQVCDPEAMWDIGQPQQVSGKRQRAFVSGYRQEDDPDATEDDEAHKKKSRKYKISARNIKEAVTYCSEGMIVEEPRKQATFKTLRSPRTIQAADTLLQASRGRYL